MRQLTQAELDYLFPNIHKDAHKFASFLTDYNLAVSARKRINFHHGNRGRLIETVVYWDTLPGHLKDELSLYEQERGIPFVGSCSNVIPFKRKSA